MALTKLDRLVGKRRIDQVAVSRDEDGVDIVYYLIEGRLYRYLDPESVDIYCPDRFVWQPIARP